MKKIAVLLITAFLLSASLYAQELQYEIRVRYIPDVAGITAEVTVSVKSGNPGFTYYLMTNDPVRGEVLQKSEFTRKKTWVFKGVKPGKYFLKIENNKGMPFGKTVVISENENSSI
jgi:hypothetical protein